ALAAAMGERDAAVDSDESWLVVTDTVFSMDGDLAPLEDICDVAAGEDEYVVVDEAHATGVVGDEGTGVVGEKGLTDEVDVQIGTLSKALGSQGGFVASSSEVVDLLVNEARSFVYSTGLSPVDAAVSREAVEVSRGDEGDERRSRLEENVERLGDRLEGMGYDLICRESQIIPVLIGGEKEALQVADVLDEEGVFAPAIRPPTVPEGTSRIRVSPMATHTEEEVEKTTDAFERAGEKAGVI
ncbi:MAG: aminotransferase class I/II-fold pyridoxal phosphate-dependent enzyme, partial [Halobacteria archaeon]|nr:aminotransferase class I/II-fold pyridoxal phosphate-dependent enzyme [Halobacteria archaeon]